MTLQHVNTPLRLSEQERNIIQLAYVRGLSNDEIAAELNLSYAAVANTLARVNRRATRPGRAAIVELALAVMMNDDTA